MRRRGRWTRARHCWNTKKTGNGRQEAKQSLRPYQGRVRSAGVARARLTRAPLLVPYEWRIALLGRERALAAAARGVPHGARPGAVPLDAQFGYACAFCSVELEAVLATEGHTEGASGRLAALALLCVQWIKRSMSVGCACMRLCVCGMCLHAFVCERAWESSQPTHGCTCTPVQWQERTRVFVCVRKSAYVRVRA